MNRAEELIADLEAEIVELKQQRQFWYDGAKLLGDKCDLIEQHRGGVVLSASRAGRVYIAGPMTGYENYNFAAFNSEADRLRAKGLHVENPADHGVLDGAEWSDYLRYDIGRLATCERIHLLPGWSKSKGARLEVSIAQSLGAGIDYAEGAEAITTPGESVAVIPGGCGSKLSTGQYWGFCGETDMGQSVPALCTECGGTLKLASNQ